MGGDSFNDTCRCYNAISVSSNLTNNGEGGIGKTIFNSTL